MSKKGSITTASTLKWEDVDFLFNIAVTNKWYPTAAVIIAGCYYGIKYREITQLTWEDVQSNVFFVTGGHGRIISIKNAPKAKQAFDILFSLVSPPYKTSKIVRNRYGGVMTLQMTNRKLKELKTVSRIKIDNFSTETFRKTFGRHIYESLPTQWQISGLHMLSEYFNQKNIAVTAKYIGRGEILANHSFNSPFDMMDSFSDIGANMEVKFSPKFVRKSYVYLLKDVTLPSYIKIGKTNNLSQREGTLQAQKPSMKLYKYVEIDCEEAAYKFESMLHKNFSKYRIRGEWFELPKGVFSDLLKEYGWKDYVK